MSAYVGTNRSGFAGNASSQLSKSASLYLGYIAIRDASAVYTFCLGSDDGSQLVIAGTQGINDDGDQGFSTVSKTLSFTQTGLYSIYVQHFEDGGSTGITVLQNGNALATKDLYAFVSSVSEPAPFFLLGAGIAALSVMRRRKGS